MFFVLFKLIFDDFLFRQRSPPFFERLFDVSDEVSYSEKLKTLKSSKLEEQNKKLFDTI